MIGRSVLQCIVAGSILVSAGAAMAQFSPVRPPAVPLITRSPYVSTWVTNNPPGSGSWPSFWNGNTKALTIMAYVDGKAYLLMGLPKGVPNNATQTKLQITPTRSIYTMQCGGASVTLNFLSPIEANDLRRMSIPLGYIVMTAKSTDGTAHAVSLYADISGEWANGDGGAQINWKPEAIVRSVDGSKTDGTIVAWEVSTNTPRVLTETNEYPNWGTAVFATATASNLSGASGPDTDVRGEFVSSGMLKNSNDTNQPRAINNNWPVFAYCRNLGNVTSMSSAPFTLLLGHVRNPDVSYLGANVPPLWLSYWPNYQAMLAFAYNDSGAAQTRAAAFDARVTKAATRVGGPEYAGVVDVSLRQAMAGTELVGTADKPWLFLKEISSDGNVSTIDVAYPAFSAYLYVDPTLVRLLMDPLFDYAESGHWPQTYAEHDLGSSYPNASGHNDGGGENMPVEESANMLIMADAYMKYNSDSAVSKAYAIPHSSILPQWANYLLTVPSGVTSCNALDPQYQNQTDDFTGSIAHSSNLALKAILAVGAMGQIAGIAGNDSDQTYFSQQAKQLIGQWVKLSQNSTFTHLLLQYREPANQYSPDTTKEPDTAWSLKYNAYPDKLLGLNLVPDGVLTEEASWDIAQEKPYGIQLDYRNSYTKIDWELFTAGATNSAALRHSIIDEVFNYANTTSSSVPLSDWYEPLSGNAKGFQARPVVGGLFAPMLQWPNRP